MKLFASDYDGTLNNHGITPELLEALARWRENGNCFGVISGRSYESISQRIQADGLTLDFLIANNGAVITDAAGRLLHHSPIRPADLAELFALLQQSEYHYLRVDTAESSYELAPGEEITVEDQTVVIGSRRFMHITELTVVQNQPEQTLALCQQAEALFDGRIRALRPSFRSIDFVSWEAGKAGGIRQLLRCLSLRPEKILTAGNSTNDLDMLLADDFIGYAVEGSMPEVWDAAPHHALDIPDLLQKETGMSE